LSRRFPIEHVNPQLALPYTLVIAMAVVLWTAAFMIFRRIYAPILPDAERTQIQVE
jgi:hypothetical protein